MSVAEQLLPWTLFGVVELMHFAGDRRWHSVEGAGEGTVALQGDAGGPQWSPVAFGQPKRIGNT